MLRGELKNNASWMVQFGGSEPFEAHDTGVRTNIINATPANWLQDKLNMFSSKINDKDGSKSIFYTDLENYNDDEDNANSVDSEQQESEQAQFAPSSFHAIPNFTGFSRFQPFVMSTSGSSIHVTSSNQSHSQSSLVKISHTMLEYSKTSPFRYTPMETCCNNQYENDAISESESEEESEDSKSLGRSSLEEPNQTSHDAKVAVNQKIDARVKKAKHIAEELLATEKHYVSILHLIDQVFQFRVDQENRAHAMFPPETVPQIFSNVKSIYKFHHDFLLPQLEARIECWDADPKIGDVMKNFAPFLKMYTEYVKNFDSAMTLINTLQQKVPRFAAIVNEIQKMEECAKLTLAHHMLCPIQRLPRYELLLKDYLKNLNKDSPEYLETKKALELVSTAANHTNDAMKKIDKFKKLLEIQESIHDLPYLVSATRELVKEGRIVKISARSGDHQDRYLFLFNDILLLCSLRVIHGPQYRLRAKFCIEELQVREGDNLEIANTFYIRDKNKSVELYTHSATEKAAWLEALFDTMTETMKRKSSLKVNSTNSESIKIEQEDATRCMICATPFSVMKRKHNCRACGMIICSKCSNQKLLFEDQKNVRVCRLCYTALTQSLKSPTSPSGPAPTLLQVSANAPSVISGFLQMKTQASKHWTRRWFALHEDFVLYTFKSETESMALTAMPMPGFNVIDAMQLPEDDPLSSKDRTRAIKIHHAKKQYYLQSHSLEDKQKWMNALQLATKAELPLSKENHEEN